MEEKTKKLIRALIIFLIIFALAFLVEVYPMLFTNIHSGNFVVWHNSTVMEIAGTLKGKKLIIDPYGFYYIVKFKNVDSKLKSGSYSVNGINSVFDIIDTLEKGVPSEQITVTIPEGFTVKEIAKRLYENGIIASEKSFIKNASPMEGYLFPDTYFFTRGESQSKIIETMRKRFIEVLPKDFNEKVKEKGLTEKQAVVLASIVEKEAKFDSDKPIVASVFLNRLKVNMPLQSDATINYILPQKKSWLSTSDLSIDSPYNTYRYAGLPPGAISNPGLKSLLAVIKAPKTDYYYFLSKPNGETVFEKTLEEHNKDIAKYYGG